MIRLLRKLFRITVHVIVLLPLLAMPSIAQDETETATAPEAPADLVTISPSGFQDVSGVLRVLDLAAQAEGTNWVGFEIQTGPQASERVIVVSAPRIFGAGLLRTGRALREAPAVIMLVGPEGSVAGIPQVVTWSKMGWRANLSLPASETVGVAIGITGTPMLLAAALAAEETLTARAARETRLQGLLFGAGLTLMALLFGRGVLSGHALFFSSCGVAGGLTLFIATSAGWHGAFINPESALFGGMRAAALLLFLAFGLDFARRAMKLKALSPLPNLLALGTAGVSIVLAAAALVLSPVTGFAAPFAVLVTLLAGIVVVEGTRQDVVGPKLLLGPWFLFSLAALIGAGLAIFAAPRFGSDGVLLIEAVLVAATLAATLSIDRLTAPESSLQGMAHIEAHEPSRGPEHRLRQALGGARKGVWDWKIHGDRLYLSGGAMALLGFDAEGGEGGEEAFFTRVHGEDQDAYRERLRSEVDRGAGHFVHDMRVLVEGGGYRWVRLEAEVTGSTTQTGARIVGLLSDVNSEYERAANRGDNALRDPLTGLPSRGQFMDRVEQALQNERAPPAVIVMDVDRFEAINDGVGHTGGDTMLIVLARRMEGVLDQGGFVARLGDDEFGVLIVDAHPDRVLDLTEALRDILSEPTEVNGQEIFPSLSFGIAFAGDGNKYDQPILRRAEVAMYHAKRSGGGRIDTFRPEFAKRKGELMSLEAGLNRALERREVELLYQPIVSVADGRLAGFEALMRWNHPEHGQMSPDRFISLAEETGAIIPLGRYVLEAAATQLMAWQHAYKRDKAIFVGVNLSARQILHHDLARDVEKILQRTKLARRSLLVEVTESVVMENPELAERRLLSLNAEGIGLALDDFGTGYSSLSHLARFAFSKLKIDRSFVEAMESDEDTLTIVRAVVSLARDLNMEVVAEGVQTERQLRLLHEMECTYAQGFLFAKPMTAAQAERLIINDQKVDEEAEKPIQARPASPES